jgi:glyoxylase-like metal-dependent hydrolase (beta-lactamase superfamily II)
VCRNSTCIVIDPGEDIENVVEYVRSRGLSLEAILITHGHPDHFAGSPKLKKVFPKALIYMSFLDLEVAEAMMLELYPDLYNYLYNNFVVERNLTQGTHTFGPIEVEAIRTPGHSPGSTALYIRNLEAVFTGGLLLAGSVGVTYIFGGSEEDIVKSICKLYKLLPHKTRVYPGHGPQTTLEQELLENYYVKMAVEVC